MEIFGISGIEAVIIGVVALIIMGPSSLATGVGKLLRARQWMLAHRAAAEKEFRSLIDVSGGAGESTQSTLPLQQP